MESQTPRIELLISQNMAHGSSALGPRNIVNMQAGQCKSAVATLKEKLHIKDSRLSLTFVASLSASTSLTKWRGGKSDVAVHLQFSATGEAKNEFSATGQSPSASQVCGSTHIIHRVNWTEPSPKKLLWRKTPSHARFPQRRSYSLILRQREGRAGVTQYIS